MGISKRPAHQKRAGNDIDDMLPLDLNTDIRIVSGSRFGVDKLFFKQNVTADR